MQLAKPRILIYRTNLSQGGADRVAIVLLRELSHRGFSTELILMRRHGPWLDEIDKNVAIHDLDRSRLYYLTLPLARLLRRLRPEVFLCLDGGGNVPAVLAHRLAGRPCRLVLSERSNILVDGKSVRRRFHVVLKRLIYPLADRITAVSHGVKQDLVERLRLDPQKISVVYNPIVDDQLIQLASEPLDDPWLQEGTPTILCAARLVPQKGLPTLIRAFDLVRRQTAARLLILGEGPLLASLESMADQLGCRPDVRFERFDTNPYRYMSRCTVFALASQHEGLPGVLIQAMACGAPVIATDCRSGPAEIITSPGTDGILVPVGNPEALAEQLLVLLRNPELRKRMGQAARVSAQRFRVETSVDLYLSALFPSGKEEATGE